MSIENLTLKEITSLAGDIEHTGKKIVILSRGWVVVGDIIKKGTYFILQNGSVVRRWGTTAGLGQIAMGGPTEDTILDPLPETIFHELTVIALIKCDEQKWKC